MQGDIEKQDIIMPNNKENIIYIYTIYKDTLDYPNSIIARVFEVNKGSIKASNMIKKFEDLNTCKDYFESRGLIYMSKHYIDDKNIVCSYM